MEKQALNAVKKHLIRAIGRLAANPGSRQAAARVERLSDAARASKLYGMDPVGSSRLADGTLVSASTGLPLPYNPTARNFMLASETTPYQSVPRLTSAADKAPSVSMVDQAAMLEGLWRPSMMSRVVGAGRNIVNGATTGFKRAVGNLATGMASDRFLAASNLSTAGRIRGNQLRNIGRMNFGGADVNVFKTRPAHTFNEGVGTQASAMESIGGRNIISIDRRPVQATDAVGKLLDPWAANNPAAVLEHELGHAVASFGDDALRNRMTRRLAVEVNRQNRITGGDAMYNHFMAEKGTPIHTDGYGKMLVPPGIRDYMGTHRTARVSGYGNRMRLDRGYHSYDDFARRNELANEAMATYIPQVMRGNRSAIARFGPQGYQGTSLLGYRQASPEFRNVMNHLERNYNYGEADPFSFVDASVLKDAPKVSLSDILGKSF